MFTQEAIKKEYDYDTEKGELVRKDCNKRKEPHKRKSIYSNVMIDGRAIREHRAIWIWHHGPIPDGLMIDHKDGNTHNNRIENLRLCTRAQNKANSVVPRNNSCGLKGVYKVGKRYCADIRKDGACMRVGTFDTAKEAATAYDTAALRLYGEFARTNESLGLV